MSWLPLLTKSSGARLIYLVVMPRPGLLTSLLCNLTSIGHSRAGIFHKQHYHRPYAPARWQRLVWNTGSWLWKGNAGSSQSVRWLTRERTIQQYIPKKQVYSTSRITAIPRYPQPSEMAEIYRVLTVVKQCWILLVCALTNQRMKNSTICF